MNEDLGHTFSLREKVVPCLPEIEARNTLETKTGWCAERQKPRMREINQGRAVDRSRMEGAPPGETK